MAFDNLVLGKIAATLAQVLADAFVGAPYALGENQYALPFHAASALTERSGGRGELIIDLDPNKPFVSYALGKFTKTVDNTPFFNSLRRLQGTRITGVAKEQGERIITISFANAARALGDLVTGYQLILELFPSRPNAFLVPQPYGLIAGLYKERGDITSVRYLNRNMPYVYPPVRPEFTREVKTLEAAKPLLANEVYRLLAAAAAKVGFAQAQDELLSDPGLYYGHGTIIPAAFGDSQARRVDVSEIYSCFVNDQRQLAKTLKEKDLVDRIRKAVKTTQRKIKNMQDDYGESLRRLAYKDWGNLLFLYQTEYVPGAKQMVLEGTAIPLDPTKDVIANANDYFRRYRKAKQAVVTLRELEAKAQDELRYLQKKLDEIRLGGNRDLAELKEELVFEGYLKDPSRRGKTLKRRKTYAPHIMEGPDQTRIGYGMNGLQNETLTFQVAHPDDLFLHVKDYPGAHVVILDHRQGNPEKLFAAELALFLSGRDSGDVMVAERRYVKKNPNKVGLVNVLRYATITLKSLRPSSVAAFARALKAK